MKRYYVQRDGDTWHASIREGSKQTPIGHGFNSKDDAMEAAREVAGPDRAVMVVEPRQTKRSRATADA